VIFQTLKDTHPMLRTCTIIKGNLFTHEKEHEQGFETREGRSNPPMHSKLIGKLQTFWSPVWENCLSIFSLSIEP